MVSLEVSGGENVPGIYGAYTPRNFTYLARGPLNSNLRTEYGTTLKKAMYGPITAD